MRTVLIIEDDQILRDMYRDAFEKNEFTATTAVDGEVGLKLALEDMPDLILLDLSLPKMDGTTVLEKLRDDEWGKHASVIVLTNLNIDGEVLNKIIENRPAYCLMKVGVTPEEVITRAKEII